MADTLFSSLKNIVDVSDASETIKENLNLIKEYGKEELKFERAEFEDDTGATLKVSYIFYKPTGEVKRITVTHMPNPYASFTVSSFYKSGTKLRYNLSSDPFNSSNESPFTEENIQDAETMTVTLEDIIEKFGQPIKIKSSLTDIVKYLVAKE